MARAEGSTAIFDVSTARQLNPRRRQSTAHTEFSVAGRAHVKGGTISTMNTPTMSSGSHGEQAKRTFAAAVRFAGLVVAVAMAVLVLGLLWVSGCKSGTGDEALAQCGGAQRNLLGIGSPLILLLGGLGAFVRTYQVWRARGRWWIWQGAGWFLLVLMLVVLTMTVPVAMG